MKLQDALKRIFREFGISALKEKRLVFLLSDYKAFDDYPAVKQIIKAIADDGYGKELCRLGMDCSREDCLNYAVRLKKSLSADRNFKPELAGFAVDCIIFAMGLISSVREPSDHGFDPCGNGTPSPGQIGSATKSDGGAAPDDSMEILSGSWASTAGTADSTTVAEKIQRQSVTQTGSTSSLESSVTGPRAPAGQQNPNSAGSPDNQVPVQNSSGSSITPDKVYYSDKQYSLFSPVGWFTDKGRIGRAEFWGRLTIWSLLVFVFYRLCLEDYEPQVAQSKFEGFCYTVSWGAIGLCYISILLRRCWDLDHRNGFAIFSPFVAIFGVAFLLSLCSSRDVDNSSVWEIVLVTLFGILFLLWGGHYLIRILFFKGTDGPNKYGPDPTKKKLDADDSMEILSDSSTSTAGTADSTTVTEKIQRQSALQTDSTSSLGSPLIAPRAPAGQQNPNSAGSTDNQVPVQNSSGSSITPDQKYYSDKHYNLQSIAGWFTSKGRIGRTEFWCRIIVSLAVFTGLILLLLWCSRVFHHLEDAAILLGVFFFIVFLVSFVCTLVKRCHDLCWSGWAAFMLIWPLRFVPPLARNGSYWVLFVLSLFLGLYWIRICIGKGTDGENKYGPDPTIKAL